MQIGDAAGGWQGCAQAIEDELRHAIVAADTVTPVPRMLIELKGIGNEFATVLWTECLYRRFDNRRQVAAYAGLAPTPWQSGSLIESRGSRRPAIRACGPCCFNWLGCGYATNPTRF